MRSHSFEEVLRKQYRELIRQKKDLPQVVGTVALRHFKKGMQKEGFIDRRLKKWPEVQRRKPGHPRFNPKRQQKILVGPGSGGIQNTLRIKRASFKETIISSMGKKYAAYHNEGNGRLPKRQFLGNSVKLEREVERIIKDEFDKAFRK